MIMVNFCLFDHAQTIRVIIFFSLKIFDFLYGEVLDSHGPLKLIIVSALF